MKGTGNDNHGANCSGWWMMEGEIRTRNWAVHIAFLQISLQYSDIQKKYSKDYLMYTILRANIWYVRYDAPREHCTERGWRSPYRTYSVQPKNSIGRVEISDRNGNRNGDDRRKMDGTSRDAHELPETEVVPHIHTNSIVSRVRVLCTPYFWACFEWNSVHNVYLSTWDLQGLTLQAAGGGQTWSKARPSGQRRLSLHRLTGLRGCLKGGWGLMTSWEHAPLKGQHTCSGRWGWDGSPMSFYY